MDLFVLFLDVSGQTFEEGAISADELGTVLLRTEYFLKVFDFEDGVVV